MRSLAFAFMLSIYALFGAVVSSPAFADNIGYTFPNPRIQGNIGEVYDAGTGVQIEKSVPFHVSAGPFFAFLTGETVTKRNEGTMHSFVLSGTITNVEGTFSYSCPPSTPGLNVICSFASLPDDMYIVTTTATFEQSTYPAGNPSYFGIITRYTP